PPVRKYAIMPNRYFRFTLDHKVVGLQYLIGMLIYFFTGGLLAIGIRTELLSPTYHVMSPSMYLQVVGEHGTMMMMMMTSVILGPFGNYLVPIMIGSKRVAFPRIEALSFWLTPCAYLILLSSFLDGGFPTGWTGYAPLSIQAGVGMDGYAVAFGLMGISIILAGFNLVVTIICYRAPGMRWSRLPAFVWAMLTTGFLLVLAAPVLVGGMYMIITDRTAQTAFFVDQLGGSGYLYQDLFWFFGHPEVYILILPGFGIISEVIPTFSRKPLFGYPSMVVATSAIAFLACTVWAHHMFTVGMPIAGQLFFMYVSLLVGVPTGVKVFNWLATMWEGSLTFETPMLFAVGFLFVFVVGGLTGIIMALVPVDIQIQDTYYIIAHFHYTMVAGSLFAMFAGTYYWLPKWTGHMYDETLGRWHFWLSMIFFNMTFFVMHFLGLAGMPRRVPDYPLQFADFNMVASIGAFGFGLTQLLFLYVVIKCIRGGEKAPARVWEGAKGLEWTLPSPAPHHSFETPPVVR
ncbi:MAG TPA: cbb3-type cytochrome c oxidase subunit I, partial [Burkholderiales bacterium]|nr:cbb3-type cytochrome c oxidase subunit I [Burkholderiales bacterium]